MLTLTRQQVRRLAVSRQHLDAAQRPSLLNVFRDLGCVQLDPIRHVERTHLLVLWSRLGTQFDPAELEWLRFTQRALFEYWAHEASLVLTEELPVHGWLMRRHARRETQDPWFEAHREAFVPMLEQIRAQLGQGPKLARDLILEPGPQQNGRWWRGSYVGRLLDLLWTQGEVMVMARPFNNHRVWGLAPDFWPDWTPHEVWTDEQLTRFAAQKAIRALGVATPTQIKRHYTRRRYPHLPAVLAQLKREGILHEVSVVGADGQPLRGPWYLHQQDMPLLAQIQVGEWHGRTTLLSPFDNLLCDRERTEQLFDFSYRIEIYVPAAKRQYGYYVLPILHQDRLIGRVDAEMNRKTGALHIHRHYPEPDAPEDAATVDAIRQTAADLGQFLGAGRVVW